MTREFPRPCPAEWYEARKWPKAWYLLGDLNRRMVLDIGCLTGWLGWLAQECGAVVTATDIFGSAVHPSLDFVLAQKEALPFADGSFDQVITANVLHHGNLDPVLREIARVLKPGGLFTTLQEPCIPDSISEQEELERACAGELAKGLDERRYHGREYQESVKEAFASSAVWLCHGSSLVPSEHNHVPALWSELGDYHGGIGIQARK